MISRRTIIIPAGHYNIGIESDIAVRLKTQLPPDLKIQWFFNSIPRHSVYVKNFCISSRLITVSEFDEFVARTGYMTEAEADGWGWTWNGCWEKSADVSWRKPFMGDANLDYLKYSDIFPVLQITWNDANEYCKWRSISGISCRLPDETEWEIFASIIGYQSITDEIIIRDKIRNERSYFDEIIKHLEMYKDGHRPGLVWEWVNDWFLPYPGGGDNKEYGTVYKILRGGSLASHEFQRTREFRFRRCPTARSPFYGFRCIVE